MCWGANKCLHPPLPLIGHHFQNFATITFELDLIDFCISSRVHYYLRAETDLKCCWWNIVTSYQSISVRSTTASGQGRILNVSD